MVKFLNILFLFLIVGGGNSVAASLDCVRPVGESSFTTWVSDSLDCIDVNDKNDKAEKLILLSEALLKNLEDKTNKADLLNGVSALIWIIQQQVQNGDAASAFINEDKVFETLGRINMDSYAMAKLLLPLADIWVQFKFNHHARPLLNRLIQVIPDIPQKSQDHSNAQKMVLISILELLKRGGMSDLEERAKSTYGHLLN